MVEATAADVGGQHAVAPLQLPRIPRAQQHCSTRQDSGFVMNSCSNGWMSWCMDAEQLPCNVRRTPRDMVPRCCSKLQPPQNHGRPRCCWFLEKIHRRVRLNSHTVLSTALLTCRGAAVDRPDRVVGVVAKADSHAGRPACHKAAGSSLAPLPLNALIAAGMAAHGNDGQGLVIWAHDPCR